MKIEKLICWRSFLLNFCLGITSVFSTPSWAYYIQLSNPHNTEVNQFYTRFYYTYSAPQQEEIAKRACALVGNNMKMVDCLSNPPDLRKPILNKDNPTTGKLHQQIVDPKTLKETDLSQSEIQVLYKAGYSFYCDAQPPAEGTPEKTRCDEIKGANNYALLAATVKKNEAALVNDYTSSLNKRLNNLQANGNFQSPETQKEFSRLIKQLYALRQDPSCTGSRSENLPKIQMTLAKMFLEQNAGNPGASKNLFWKLPDRLIFDLFRTGVVDPTADTPFNKSAILHVCTNSAEIATQRTKRLYEMANQKNPDLKFVNEEIQFIEHLAVQNKHSCANGLGHYSYSPEQRSKLELLLNRDFALVEEDLQYVKKHFAALPNNPSLVPQSQVVAPSISLKIRKPDGSFNQPTEPFIANTPLLGEDHPNPAEDVHCDEIKGCEWKPKSKLPSKSKFLQLHLNSNENNSTILGHSNPHFEYRLSVSATAPHPEDGRQMTEEEELKLLAEMRKIKAEIAAHLNSLPAKTPENMKKAMKSYFKTEWPKKARPQAFLGLHLAEYQKNTAFKMAPQPTLVVHFNNTDSALHPGKVFSSDPDVPATLDPGSYNMTYFNDLAR